MEVLERRSQVLEEEVEREEEVVQEELSSESSPGVDFCCKSNSFEKMS